MNAIRSIVVFLMLASVACAQDCVEILAALDRAVAQKPTDVDTLLNLGVNRFRCGTPAAALDPLRKVIELAPTNSTSYFYLGVSLLALDRDEEAKNAFRRMAALSPGDADQLFILQKGYSRLTSALLERMTEMAPDSARVHQMRAELLDVDHQPDRALEEYKQAVSKEPNVAALHYALGCAYWARFRAADAVPEFESAIRIDSSHYMARYKLGLALTELDRVPDAIQQFKKTLELQPGLANAHLGLAKAYSHIGDSESALASAGECLKLDPNNESALYLRAQMFHKLGREHEANEQLSNLRAIRERAKENHPQ